MRSSTAAGLGFGLLALIWVAAVAAFWGTVVYVSLHYIFKFW